MKRGKMESEARYTNHFKGLAEGSRCNSSPLTDGGRGSSI